MRGECDPSVHPDSTGLSGNVKKKRKARAGSSSSNLGPAGGGVTSPSTSDPSALRHSDAGVRSPRADDIVDASCAAREGAPPCFVWSAGV